MRSAPTPRRLSSPPVLPANSRKRSAATRPPGRPAPAMRGSARSPAKWSRPVISTADMTMTCPMPIMPPAATPRTGIINAAPPNAIALRQVWASTTTRFWIPRRQSSTTRSDALSLSARGIAIIAGPRSPAIANSRRPAYVRSMVNEHAAGAQRQTPTMASVMSPCSSSIAMICPAWAFRLRRTLVTAFRQPRVHAPAQAGASGSRPTHSLQTAPQHRDGSGPRQSPRRPGHANPAIVPWPSMPASSTRTDSESELPCQQNPWRSSQCGKRSKIRYVYYDILEII